MLQECRLRMGRRMPRAARRTSTVVCVALLVLTAGSSGAQSDTSWITKDKADRGCENNVITCAPAAAADSADHPTFASLTIELAATHKTLADQLFLLDTNRVGAMEHYCVAEAKLHEIDQHTEQELSPADLSVLSLLRADVDYRKALLAGGASFWGIQGATPLPPMAELNLFDTTLSNYQSTAKEIDRALEKNTQVAQTLAVIASHQVAERLNQFSGQQSTAIKQIQSDRFTSVRQTATKRLQQVRVDIAQTEGEAHQVASSIDQMNKAIGDAILDAAASAAGVPPGVVSGIKDGKVDKAIQAAVVAVASDPSIMQSPSVASAVSDLTSRSPELRTLMDQAGKAVETVNDLKAQAEVIKYRLDTAQNAVKVLRDPSVDSLVTLGNAAWKALPEQTRKDLQAGIEQSKPVGTLVQVATMVNATGEDLKATVEKARKNVASALGKIDDEGRMLTSQVNEFMDGVKSSKDWELMSGMYRDTYANTAAALRLFPEKSQKLLNNLVQVAPDKFAGWLDDKNPVAFQALLKANNLKTREDLVQQLRAGAGLDPSKGPLLKGIQVQTIAGAGDDAIYLIDAKGKRTLFANIPTAFRDLSVNLPRDGDYGRLADNIKDTYAAIAGNGPDARARLTINLLDRAPTVVQALVNERSLAAGKIATTTAEANAARLAAQQFRDNLWQPIDSKLKTAIADVASKVAVGEQLASRALATQTPAQDITLDQISDAPSDGGMPPAAPGPGGGDGGGDADAAKAKLMAEMALNAAFPGAGVALHIVSQMFEMDRQYDKLNALFEDERRLLAEEHQLVASVQNAEIEQGITEREKSVAEASTKAAEAQIAIWSQAASNASDAMDVQRGKIRARRPLVFFDGEELRRHFDLFNRSMTLWSGIGNDGDTFLERFVKGNPQFLRFAVDHDIQLYSWMNRERDGSRVDLDLVAQRWSQKQRLLHTVCATDSGMGCTPGMGGLNEMGEADATLGGLLRHRDRDSFKNLIDSRSGSQDFDFVVTPNQPPMRPEERNVRLLDVHADWVDGNGKVMGVPVRGVQLEHPGPGTLVGGGPDGITLTHEVLAPRAQAGFAPGGFGDMRNSFGPIQANMAKGDKETSSPRLYGYAPLTTWHVSVLGSAVPKGAADLRFTFAYVFSRGSGLRTEADYVELLRHRQVQQPTPEAALQAEVRQEFPVTWYRFVAIDQNDVDKTDVMKTGWVHPVSGPLLASDVLLQPGMAPLQAKVTSSSPAAILSCDGKPPAKAKVTEAPPVAAVCLSRDHIAQSLSRHLRMAGSKPLLGGGLSRMSEPEAIDAASAALKLLDASKLCTCSGTAPANTACFVQGAL